MKSVYIHCPLLADEDYSLVLQGLCPESVRNITVYTRLPAGVKPRDLEQLVQVQKDFSRDRQVRFRNYGIFPAGSRFPRAMRRVLHKNGIAVELQVLPEKTAGLAAIVRQLEKAGVPCRLRVTQAEDPWAVYDRFAQLGLPVCFEDPRYDAQTPERFDRWLTDPKAQGVNIFTDILTMLTLQTYSPNCRHGSCFGNTFGVDENLDTYLCPHRMTEMTRLGNLRQATRDELMTGPAVAQFLPGAVQKRRSCAESCGSFPHCQGGCLMENSWDCAGYQATVEHIRGRLQEIYRGKDLTQVNPVVKNAILNALAFGTAFFKQPEEG